MDTTSDITKGPFSRIINLMHIHNPLYSVKYDNFGVEKKVQTIPSMKVALNETNNILDSLDRFDVTKFDNEEDNIPKIEEISRSPNNTKNVSSEKQDGKNQNLLDFDEIFELGENTPKLPELDSEVKFDVATMCKDEEIKNLKEMMANMEKKHKEEINEKNILISKQAAEYEEKLTNMTMLAGENYKQLEKSHENMKEIKERLAISNEKCADLEIKLKQSENLSNELRENITLVMNEAIENNDKLKKERFQLLKKLETNFDAYGKLHKKYTDARNAYETAIKKLDNYKNIADNCLNK
jgi:DNA repair ATPase RecN